MKQGLFNNPNLRDDQPVLFKGKSEYNGTVSCFEDKKWRYIQSIYKSRFPTTQTAVHKNNPLLSKFPFYPASLTLSLAYMYQTNPNVTLIGVAGGFLINYLQRFMPNLTLSPVEIDPIMVELAQKYFNVTKDIYTGDGYQYVLDRSEMNQDILILDAFHGMFVPEVFSDPNWYEHVRDNFLSVDGCLAMNIVVNDETLELYKVLHSKFPFIYKFYHNGNLTLICKKSPNIMTPSSTVERLQKQYSFSYRLDNMYSKYQFTGKVEDLMTPRERKSLFKK